MKQKLPVLNLIAIVVLALLIVSAGVFQFTRGIPGLGYADGRPNERGLYQGTPPANGFNSPNGQNFQPGSGTDNRARNWINGQGGNFGSGPNGNFTPNSTQFAAMQARVKLMQLERYGVGVLVILFGVLAALGLGLQKKWGKVLSIITAAIVLVYTVPSMFNFRFSANLIMDILKVVLALTAIVLVLLPHKTNAVPAPIEPPAASVE